MSVPEYIAYPLELIIPDFDSEITGLIIDLDHLRRKELVTSTHPIVFRDLLKLFHTVESVGSARIEGNNTQFIELLDAEQGQTDSIPEGIREIRNMENTLDYIEQTIADHSIDQFFICEIHRRIMEGLRPPPAGDGDSRPGQFRQDEVGIGRSSHLPPPPWEIAPLMRELTGFLETDHPSRYDLIKSSLFHHRFVWIHPFANGNGRTARMLTYAIMIKQGFRLNAGRIINPASAFCMDRELYYKSLSSADKGERDGIINWCTYMLSGLKTEMEKTDRLADHSYLMSKILLPAIHHSEKNGRISQLDSKMLKIAVEQHTVQASHFKNLFRDKLPQEISRQIKKLRESRLLVSETEGGRQYVINIRNELLRLGIMNALDREGFLPA